MSSVPDDTEYAKEDWDAAIAAGYGGLLTVEGFTIRETRDILFGSDDPALASRSFDGLSPRVTRAHDPEMG